jgi:Fe-S cluster assembly protein SufD
LPNAQLVGFDREAALERFRATPSGRERAGRYWKIDLEAHEPKLPDSSTAGTVTIDSSHERVVVCDLQVAMRDHGALLARALGRAVRPEHKWAALTQAFAGLGAFVYVPADTCADDPIVIRYDIPAGGTVFPYTVVLAERSSRATIVERFDGGENAFVCGIAEIVTDENAGVTYAAVQTLPDSAEIFFTRAGLPGRDARVTWATAELGAALAVTDVAVTIDQPGVEAKIATVFFPGGTQHVDVRSTVDHRIGDSTSETIVKSAATGGGQGRYLGNIRIEAHAQHTNASLRDDALLLSKRAHIDSVPALEIAANDVKAYHGATVGALDDEAVFYMTSRGIERSEVERMIALGFFEPALDRFPGEALREELRAALALKVR